MATRTATKTAAKKAAGSKKPAGKKASAQSKKDAVDLLDADHKAVKKMFKDYEELTESKGSRAASKKRELADRICLELTVHTMIEDEIFYPAARGAINDNSLINEAKVEHSSARDLISQIKTMDASDEMFDAKVTVLGEYIDHHVKEERTEMFPKVRKTKLDLVALREQLESRKEELMAEPASVSAAIA